MMFRALRAWQERRVLRRSKIVPAAWAATIASLPLLAGLSAGEQRRLRELAVLFLDRKRVEGVQGVVVTEPMAMVIALQACLPILELGLDVYEGWLSVLVYPAGFAVEHEVMDDYGVVHRVRSALSGEAWGRGPVILAWDETRRAGIIDGHNLVIHELAHKLDMQNGDANGYPPLHGEMSHAAWVKAFTRAYADLQQRCDAGQPVAVDPYAATSPAEFFAVMSEVFFERPDVLMAHYPAVHAQLRQYYRQDPLQRLSAAFHRISN